MRRTDCQPVVLNGVPVISSRATNLTAHPTRQEQGTTSHNVGDLWEETIAHWENAWIDIGGEG
jgi:hypothetical protein